MSAYEKAIHTFAEKIEEADAILIGAAAGMSASAGYNFFYQRDNYFLDFFGDFEKKYGFHNAFNGFYHRFPSSEHRWAFISRMVDKAILGIDTGEPYFDIKDILEGKNFHILTTNQDIQFTRVFGEEKISAIQGDWRYLQCSHRCHDGLYSAEELYHDMNTKIDSDLKIPEAMIPRCPRCGAEMEPWVRSYVFLEGKKFRREHEKWQQFVVDNQEKKILFVELGVGRMTPMFIQEPFWNLTYQLPKAFYVTVNPKDALLPRELEKKGIAIHEDIAKVLKDVKKERI